MKLKTIALSYSTSLVEQFISDRLPEYQFLRTKFHNEYTARCRYIDYPDDQTFLFNQPSITKDHSQDAVYCIPDVGAYVVCDGVGGGSPKFTSIFSFYLASHIGDAYEKIYPMIQQHNNYAHFFKHNLSSHAFSWIKQIMTASINSGITQTYTAMLRLCTSSLAEENNLSTHPSENENQTKNTATLSPPLEIAESPSDFFNISTSSTLCFTITLGHFLINYNFGDSGLRLYDAQGNSIGGTKGTCLPRPDLLIEEPFQIPLHSPSGISGPSSIETIEDYYLQRYRQYLTRLLPLFEPESDPLKHFNSLYKDPYNPAGYSEKHSFFRAFPIQSGMHMVMTSDGLLDNIYFSKMFKKCIQKTVPNPLNYLREVVSLRQFAWNNDINLEEEKPSIFPYLKTQDTLVGYKSYLHTKDPKTFSNTITHNHWLMKLDDLSGIYKHFPTEFMPQPSISPNALAS